MAKGAKMSAWGRGMLAAAAVGALVGACGEGQSAIERTIAQQEAQELSSVESWFEEIRAREGVQQTASGLMYQVVSESADETLPKPGPQAMVLAHYEGRLRDGTVFDSSFQRGQPAAFPLTQVIPGWTEALQLMRPGDEYILFIPPELGYGPEGRPPAIPRNAPLEFRVQLLQFQNPDGTSAIAPGLQSPGGP